MYQKIGFVGLGLLGGSLAKLIKAHFPETKIYAVTRTTATIDQAADVLESGGTSINCFPTDLDLVFICTPISIINKTIKAVSDHSQNPELVITDIGSIKNEIIANIQTLKEGHLFIPGHPMAGTENTGFNHSDISIVKGAPYILTQAKDRRYDQFKQFLEDLLFKVIELSADTHDQLIALVSHIPYLMAVLTVRANQDLTPDHRAAFEQVKGPGYRDTTRVSASDYNWGIDVCTYNKENILDSISKIKAELANLEEYIKTDNKSALASFLKAT